MIISEYDVVVDFGDREVFDLLTHLGFVTFPEKGTEKKDKGYEASR